MSLRRRALVAAVLGALFSQAVPTIDAAAVPGSPAAPAAAAPTQPPTTYPIKHFVFMMQGDRSFDNYFGTYPAAAGIPSGACQAVDLNRPAEGCVKPFALHGSVPATLGGGKVELDNQYNKGLMNGFVAAYQSEGRDGRAVMGYYDQRDVGTYWNLASQYVLFDHFFSSTRDGEVANRSYWVSANADPPGTAAQSQAAYARQLTIFDRLQASGVSWKFYVQGYNPNQNFRTVSATEPSNQPVRVPLLNYARFIDDPVLKSHIVDLTQYYKDMDAGTLPAVAYVASNGPSERSARSIASGQALVSDLVTDLMLSKYWNDSAFMLSYDGSGGWYDHVKPPQIDKYGYGMRVPALLISSYARAGAIDSHTMDYTSALAFIEQNWRLAPLAKRDATANSIVSAFDFDRAPRPPRVSFSEPQTSSPSTRITPVYWTYGLAGLVVLALVATALLRPRARRRKTQAASDPPTERLVETAGARR